MTAECDLPAETEVILYLEKQTNNQKVIIQRSLLVSTKFNGCLETAYRTFLHKGHWLLKLFPLAGMLIHCRSPPSAMPL